MKVKEQSLPDYLPIAGKIITGIMTGFSLVRFGFFFNGISTVVGYLMPKPSF